MLPISLRYVEMTVRAVGKRIMAKKHGALVGGPNVWTISAVVALGMLAPTCGNGNSPPPTERDVLGESEARSLICEFGTQKCEQNAAYECGTLETQWVRVETCTIPQVCVDGACCTPNCEAKACGNDGCGGDCGVCAEPNHECQQDTCVCMPQCTPDTACESNGCDGYCDDSCFGDCYDGGCVEYCIESECGSGVDDVTCGACPTGYECIGGSCKICEPIPNCSGKECGGCGGLCGICPCIDCRPSQTVCSESGKCVSSTQGSPCETLLACFEDCYDSDLWCRYDCVGAFHQLVGGTVQELFDCTYRNFDWCEGLACAISELAVCWTEYCSL